MPRPGPLHPLLPLLLLSLSLRAADWEPFRPRHQRLMPRPDWSIDVTDALRDADGAPLSPRFTAEVRGPRVKGGVFAARLDLHIPPETDPSWPLVLFADESRVLTDPRAGGDALPGFDRAELGELWSSGEGVLLLPPAAPGSTLPLSFSLHDLPHVYPNGFGRLRLQPATLETFLQLDRNPTLAIRNRDARPHTVVHHWRAEDYFGAPLAEGRSTHTVPPGGRAAIDTAAFPADAYKLRHRLESANRAGPEYWDLRGAEQVNRARPEVLQLRDGWRYRFADSIDPAALPAGEWKAVPGLPFRPSADDTAGPVVWLARDVTLPADWPEGRELHLFLPTDIHYRARVFLDGREIGAAANWELPQTFPTGLPARPGATHRLTLAVTDYRVGLVPGVTPPPHGPMGPPGRGLAAPMDATNPLRFKFDSLPELLALPPARVDHVRVRTRVDGGKRIAADIRVRGGARLRAAVYEAGEKRLDLGEVSAAGGTASLEADAEALPEWRLDDPRLLELRAELLDAGGTVIDTHRTRFGLREFGIDGSRFTLNGRPIQLLGGSHIYVTGLLWPVRSHPYNFVRHGHSGAQVIRGGVSNGVAAMNAADESGYLLKSADWNINAHGADVYAWERPEIWRRLLDHWTRVADTFANHPSVVMWDIGNEVVFRGPGEAERMGALFTALRELDPGRLVTIGGSYPNPQPAELLNVHSWGSWNDRSDFLFAHPEHRPAYLKESGFYWRDPEGADWRLKAETFGTPHMLKPGGTREPRHVGGKPVLFAEGHYYESSFPFALQGHDALVPLPGWHSWDRHHRLNILSIRLRSIVNVRQAGVSGSMIHVDRGLGRYMMPLAGHPRDRDVRLRAGEPFDSVQNIFYNLATPGQVDARYRLLAGDLLLGETRLTLEADPFSVLEVPLRFELPVDLEPGPIFLEARLRPEGAAGEFLDTVRHRVMAPATFAMPEGLRLDLFDPAERIRPLLEDLGLASTRVETPDAWTPAPDRILLIGPDALTGLPAEALAGLGAKVEAGGRVIVLQHRELPRFLRSRLTQSPEFNHHTARLDFDSPITRGLAHDDLRSWTTREGDQLVSEAPLETPSAGRFRPHVTTVRAAPVLEVAEGRGRVLFAQMNLEGALGVDPAADRLFANLLAWTGEPSPFRHSETLLLGSSDFRNAMETRLGLVARAERLDGAELAVADGSSEALNALEAADLGGWLSRGGTLVLHGLDAEAAARVGRLLGTDLAARRFPHRYAQLIGGVRPEVAGLGHADLTLDNLNPGHDPALPYTGSDPLAARDVLEGSGLIPLASPASLAVLPVGDGRVVFNQTLGLENAMPSLIRVASVVLANAGGLLEPGSAARENPDDWVFTPVDLRPYVNRSLKDHDEPGKPRGWNASGADNDLEDLPTGEVNFRGVPYRIPTPDEAGGNAFIALSGARPRFAGLPDKVEGIAVNRKADRVHFLHVSVWGVPGFVYRVSYAEDLAKWIPGQPDPFVDVVVKPGEHILDWVDAPAVERGERFLPGARVAWLGGTPRTRTHLASGDRAVGLFEMVWENPRPDKTIAHIDILSPGGVGDGHPFVLGVTTAVRRAGPPLPPLAEVLPGGVAPEQVAHHARFDAYGYVLLKDGTLACVYDREARPVAASRGWRLEDQPASGGAPRLLATQARRTPEIATRRRDGGWEHTVTGTSTSLDYAARWIATPAALRYELEVTARHDPEPGRVLKVVSPFDLLEGDTSGVKVNTLPVPLSLPGGRGSFSFDRRNLVWVFSYFVHDRGIGVVVPPKNAPPLAEGATERLWWEATFP